MGGKKVTQGLDKDFGDVDVFHYESSPTVKELCDRLSSELTLVTRNKIN